MEQVYGKIRILEEKRTGRSRADVVMVLPDKVCGIEIKSDADSYARLASQVKDYDRYYDLNIVAVGTSHASHIEEHVPAHWGIITVEELPEGPDFYFLRHPLDNPDLKPENKIEILWRPELARIQERNDMPKYKEKSKDFVRKKILEKVDPKLLAVQISDELFERDYTAIEETIRQFRAENRPQKRKRKRTRRKY